MVLKDTIQEMISEDYKERFIAEYKQIFIRMCGLKKVIDNYHRGTLDFVLQTPISLLEEQYKIMNSYCECLIKRSLIENISLPEVII